MGSTAVKTASQLRKEIEELDRQHSELTKRLRDPRGIRRGGISGAGPRNFVANGGRQRGYVRPAERNDAEDQPPAKKRLSSAVVNEFEIHPPAPRVLPKDEDPSLVSRNKRMFGQLLGTLERFRKEDEQKSCTEAYVRRSDSLKRAEQRAHEESEKLRQQEHKQISEKRKRDLTLRARIAAKAEEKELELLFLRWSMHYKRLGNFIRTKAEPPIYYKFFKPVDHETTLTEEQKEQTFQEWKAYRREELSQYQKQMADQHVAHAEKEHDRWQKGRKGRRGNEVMANLQETMDKELETHQLEHGPKIRNIPGQSNNEIEDEDADDVEDKNDAEDYMMMDDMLGVDENIQRVDESVKVEEGRMVVLPLEDNDN